jgi:hypothetical protein
MEIRPNMPTKKSAKKAWKTVRTRRQRQRRRLHLFSPPDTDTVEA